MRCVCKLIAEVISFFDEKGRRNEERRFVDSAGGFEIGCFANSRSLRMAIDAIVAAHVDHYSV